MGISACVIAKNESLKIADCIKNLSFCDEVLVYDTGSTDNTASVATLAGAKVIKDSNNKSLDFDFSYYREAISLLAKNDWLLHIDADEKVSDELKSEILNAVSNLEYEAYFIGREDIFYEKKITHGEISTAHNTGFIRLYKKGKGGWVGKVHERFQPSVSCRVGFLRSKIQHFAHDNMSEFISKVNHYSSLRAIECQDKVSFFNFFSILFVPLFKFIQTFFLKKGFVDKEPGFIYSFLMSFHSFLSRSKAYVFFDR